MAGLRRCINELIYAKIENYPWWPAQIVKHHYQNNQSVYKVHFLGDPTYCYLHQNDMIDFTQYHSQLNVHYQYDFKLEKAHSLANSLYERKKCYQSPQNSLLLENSNDQQEKTQFYEWPKKAKQIPKITHHNVIQLLQCRMNQNNNKYNLYQQQSMKKCLLKKYNLDDEQLFSRLNKNKNRNKKNCKVKKIKKKKNIIKNKGIKNHTLNYTMSIKQLYRILNMRKIPKEVSKMTAIMLINYINTIVQYQNIIWKKLYLAISKWIGSNINYKIGQDDLNYLKEIFIPNIMIGDQDRKQDQQKSKLTQLSI